VDVVNTFNADIRFGIFDLQFGNVSPAVPEPGAAASLLNLACVGGLLLRRRLR
jgi:hypothetical protein